MKANHLKTMPAKKRTLLLVISLCLVITLTVTGTAAWMYFKAVDTAVNTFKGTDLTITFGGTSDTQMLVPGESVIIPVVEVKAGSVPSYLFVRIHSTSPTDSAKFLSMTPNSYSTYTFKEYTVDGNDTYWYCKIPTPSVDAEYNAFLNQRISVNTNVTKEEIKNVSAFTVTIQYCAVQSDNLDLNTAFGLCQWS